MADQKISELTALTGANVADDDAIAIVDTSATETKKIVFSELKNALDTATGFVRITGDTMTGDLSMGDNVKAIFGAGGDLEIYHSGFNSFIDEVGTGYLQIRASDNITLKSAADELYVNCVNNGAVTLYYDNAAKLATTSTGIDVTGTVTADAYALDSIALPSAGTATIFNRNTDNNLYIQTDSGNTVYLLDGSQNTMYAASPTSHIFQISNAEKMRIDSSGNVGIGTSSPAQKLNVNGRFQIDAGWEIKLQNAAQNGFATIQNVGAGTNTDLRFSTADSERMRIDSSGNVGIGTTSPSDDVEISTSADGKGLTIKNAGNNRPYLNFDSNRSSAGNNLAELHFKWNGTDVARIIAVAGSDTTNKDDGHITFSTSSTGSVDERMRLDSSGNLLVGATFSDSANVGHGLNPNGFTYHTRSAGEVLRLNRKTSDGSIVGFRKDGATVGSIGVASSDNIYLAGNSSHAAIGLGTNSLYPADSVGNAVDNSDDLGGVAFRWKDLYLSGGVYLGGTGAANKLDDYEEGTWTCSLHLPPDSLTNTDATAGSNRYTKVGNFVTVQGKVTLSANSTSSSALRLSGLPFTTSSNTAITGSLICRNGASFPFNPYVFGSTTEVHFYQISPSGTWNQVSYNEVGAIEMHFEISYFAT